MLIALNLIGFVLNASCALYWMGAAEPVTWLLAMASFVAGLNFATSASLLIEAYA